MLADISTGECCCGLPGPHATASQCLQAHTSHNPTSCTQQSTPATLGPGIFQVCVRAVGALPARHCSEGVWLGGCDRPAGPLLSACAGLHCRSASHLPVLTSPAWLLSCYRHGCNTRGCYVMTILRQALDHFIINCFQLITWRCFRTYLQALPINVFGLCDDCCYSLC